MNANSGYLWWQALLIAFVGGGATAIISAIVNYISKSKQTEILGEKSLRSDLMQERIQLKKELEALTARCDNIEKENHDLKQQMLVMEQLHFQEKMAMQQQIDTLTSEVSDLREQLSRKK